MVLLRAGLGIQSQGGCGDVPQVFRGSPGLGQARRPLQSDAGTEVPAPQLPTLRGRCGTGTTTGRTVRPGSGLSSTRATSSRRPGRGGPAGPAARSRSSGHTEAVPSRARWSCRSSSRRSCRRDPAAGARLPHALADRSVLVSVRPLPEREHAPGGRLDPAEGVRNPRPSLERVVLPVGARGRKLRHLSSRPAPSRGARRTQERPWLDAARRAARRRCRWR